MARKRSGSQILMRLAPFGAFTGFGTLAFIGDAYTLAALLGVGAFVTGSGSGPGEDQAQGAVAAGAGQRAGAWQGGARGPGSYAADEAAHLTAEGLLESWELLPEEYRPLLDGDVSSIVGEVEGTARLARRRAALRRHLESIDRRQISRRIEGLERDLAELEEGSPLRAPFETALSGRRGELASCADILDGISRINAQLEGAESLLGNLRGGAARPRHQPLPGLARAEPRAPQGEGRVLPSEPRRGDAKRRDPARDREAARTMSEERPATRGGSSPGCSPGTWKGRTRPRSTRPGRSVWRRPGKRQWRRGVSPSSGRPRS